MKKMMKILGCVLLGMLSTHVTHAETIRVGFEPFPPLITSDLKGYTIDLLHAIEKNTPLTFDIKIMSYKRAQKELKNGTIDLMGHTPHMLEVNEFYEYAQELDWSIDTRSDYFAKEPKFLNNPKTHKVGTPRGNAPFFSEVLSIPIDKFYETKIENLLKMMGKGRKDVQLVVYERGATMSMIRELNLKGIYYKDTGLDIKAGLAVAKSGRGDNLKKLLEKSISEIHQETIFKTYNYYINLPSHGRVTW